MTVAIQADEVGVRFLLDRQRRLVTPALARFRRRGSEVWGLRDITLDLGPGEGVALLGPSGAGKTTLLRALAGVLRPDRGRLSVRGRVGTLLSSTAGTISTLTGRENSLLLGVLAGLSRRQAGTWVDDVKQGSGLGEAFERPVGSFSQGMYARLGLAVAERTQPQILLLDEVHEALDHEYRALVDEWVHALLAAGGIVVAAGHEHALLERFCDRGLLMREGRLEADGAFGDVRDAYLA